MTSSHKAPRLADLLAGVDFAVVAGDPAQPVRAVVADSRIVEPGDVFVCLPGYRADGGELRADRHDFVAQASARGAVAVVVERAVEVPACVTVLRVANAWSAIASMACAYYGNPSRQLCMIGVTGTSGKTSTTYFIESILRAAGWSVARFGTIEYRFGDVVEPAVQTTPEAPELQRLLRRAVDMDCRAVVMEVSSHALALRRTDGIAFDVAVFTNLSQDHLNFHADMEDYGDAKRRLFASLGRHGKRATAVINADDPRAAFMLDGCAAAPLTFGIHAAATVIARGVRLGLDGTHFVATTPAGDIEVRLPHLGDYTVYNALAALASGLSLGIAPATMAHGLAVAPPVPGRFELVAGGQPFQVAVDYAHKPDALERLLRSGRALGPRRIITVFGCGGDRDRGKRALMGEIAARASDLVFVTSDNPRSEDPEAIVAEILAGARRVPNAGNRVRSDVDRARAIAAAIDAAEPGDLVLIAGKGHETYQLFAGRRVHFDDREVARAALARRYRGREAMPAS
ncbi:UDP-N-acetylmuramoyl-L-alanyl-D-glutamate--2,6-diaminopimelate ligase [Candidatus Binatia bacterium]|nr:UDP-N-acetylmuramoyl-L-alanyl-D-glutamate--2,6-diaminopimelate ligase [Candidatus Binatia bacterium]